MLSPRTVAARENTRRRQFVSEKQHFIEMSQHFARSTRQWWISWNSTSDLQRVPLAIDFRSKPSRPRRDRIHYHLERLASRFARNFNHSTGRWQSSFGRTKHASATERNNDLRKIKNQLKLFHIDICAKDSNSPRPSYHWRFKEH